MSLGRPYFVLRPGETCAAVIADVYAVVTIPGRARDRDLVEVRVAERVTRPGPGRALL